MTGEGGFPRMKSVHVETHEDPVDVSTNARVIEAVLACQEKLPMACGGKGLCATCHVYVVEGAERLSPITPREKMSLPMLADRQPNSRLACQAKVLGNGVKIALPRVQYLDGSVELEKLIGRRTEVPIVHPLHGTVLIAPGKIITRSRIRELSFVDIDIAEMQSRCQSIEKNSYSER